jgi:NADH dehydrogenase [ubiquinone] 1 alpha subcomplex assembly factor 2
VIIMGALADLWLRWKALRLPWRKTFLVGKDLQGHTYWEFKDPLNQGRYRRIVHYNRSTPYSEVSLSPQWHQWLRKTRFDPPTLEEQSMDLLRQTQLKHNAALADARWAAKAKYIEKPKPQEPPSQEQTGQTGSPDTAEGRQGDPWKQAQDTARNPGQGWQPEAWVPGKR